MSTGRTAGRELHVVYSEKGITDLFTPMDLRGLALPNRIWMSAMTSTRASDDNLPTDPATFYGRGREGYTDYPTLAESMQHT